MKTSAICYACGKSCKKFLTNYVVVEDTREEDTKLPPLRYWYHSHKETKNKDCTKLAKKRALDIHGYYLTTTGRRIDAIREGMINEQDLSDEADES